MIQQLKLLISKSKKEKKGRKIDGKTYSYTHIQHIYIYTTYIYTWYSVS